MTLISEYLKNNFASQVLCSKEFNCSNIDVKGRVKAQIKSLSDEEREDLMRDLEHIDDLLPLVLRNIDAQAQIDYREFKGFNQLLTKRPVQQASARSAMKALAGALGFRATADSLLEKIEAVRNRLLSADAQIASRRAVEIARSIVQEENAPAVALKDKITEPPSIQGIIPKIGEQMAELKHDITVKGEQKDKASIQDGIAAVRQAHSKITDWENPVAMMGYTRSLTRLKRIIARAQLPGDAKNALQSLRKELVGAKDAKVFASKISIFEKKLEESYGTVGAQIKRLGTRVANLEKNTASLEAYIKLLKEQGVIEHVELYNKEISNSEKRVKHLNALIAIMNEFGSASNFEDIEDTADSAIEAIQSLRFFRVAEKLFATSELTFYVNLIPHLERVIALAASPDKLNREEFVKGINFAIFNVSKYAKKEGDPEFPLFFALEEKARKYEGVTNALGNFMQGNKPQDQIAFFNTCNLSDEGTRFTLLSLYLQYLKGALDIQKSCDEVNKTNFKLIVEENLKSIERPSTNPELNNNNNGAAPVRPVAQQPVPVQPAPAGYAFSPAGHYLNALVNAIDSLISSLNQQGQFSKVGERAFTYYQQVGHFEAAAPLKNKVYGNFYWIRKAENNLPVQTEGNWGETAFLKVDVEFLEERLYAMRLASRDIELNDSNYLNYRSL